MKDIIFKLLIIIFACIFIFGLVYNVAYFFTTGEDRITIESKIVKRNGTPVQDISIISTGGKEFKVTDSDVSKILDKGKTYDILTRGFNIKFSPNKIDITKANLVIENE